MTKPTRHLADFLADLCRFVEAAGEGADPMMAERRQFAGLIRELSPDWTDGSEAGSPFALPVCRFWATAVAAIDGSDPVLDLRHGLAALGPWLIWVQNPNYRRAPPAVDFLDNYGYAVIAGPADGAPALAQAGTLALGVLLLGPHTHYPLHHHPATEIYVPLGRAQWWRNDGPWREEPPGSVILHPSGVPHATRAGERPLLAVYAWSGDLGTHAQLAAAG